MKIVNKWLKQILASQIEDHALLKGEFTLANGNSSNYYIDFSRLSLNSDSARLIGELLVESLTDIKFDAIGGPVLGAAPIVSSVLMSSSLYRPIRGFLVRRMSKEYGNKEQVEGPLKKGDKVVIVEDVTTSGNSVLWCADYVKNEYNCDILQIISILDRQAGATELMNKHDYKFNYILNINDLKLP